MKRTPMLLALALIATIGPAAAITPQQQKMTACNAEATSKSLKGDGRKAFMKECLSAAKEAPALTPQQEKMKACNAEATAKGIKGPDRKAFMSACLSKSAAPAAPATPASPAAPLR